MRIIVAAASRDMGVEAARLSAAVLRRAIAEKGRARLAVSTGASQLETLAELVKQDLPWQKVELFQIGERLGVEGHGCGSCRKALKDRLARRVSFMKTYCLDETDESMEKLAAELEKEPADLLLIGLGDQGQVGFNAAPADFDTDRAYIRIPAGDGQPEEMITMSISGMLRSGYIIACAPHGLRAETVWQVVTHRLTPDIPATALKGHANFDLMLDRESAAQISVQLAAQHNPNLAMYRIMAADDEEP